MWLCPVRRSNSASIHKQRVLWHKPPFAFSGCLSALGPCDPCIPPVLISHLNTLLIVLTWNWAACGRQNVWQALKSAVDEGTQRRETGSRVLDLIKCTGIRFMFCVFIIHNSVGFMALGLKQSGLKWSSWLSWALWVVHLRFVVYFLFFYD